MTGEAALWNAIGERLDRLAARDGEVRFWLRDDDAVSPSPALDRLLGLAADAGAPLALAVVPDGATDALAARLAPLEGVAVLQHGFRHANHAPLWEKKAELGDHRPLGAVLAELAAGQNRLASFPRVAPILVPPWNRIGATIAPQLPALGFRALSLFGARGPRPAGGLAQFNTHVDSVAWKPAKRFRGRTATLAILVARLDGLLAGAVDTAEPTGVLTHHRVHDRETFTFLSDLLAYVGSRKDCRFLSAGDLLASC